MSHDDEIANSREPDSKWTVADSGCDAERIHDLQEQLAMEHERLEVANGEVEAVENLLNETRAHADALAGALTDFADGPKAFLEDRACHKGITTVDNCAQCQRKLAAYKALTAYRNREQENE